MCNNDKRGKERRTKTIQEAVTVVSKTRDGSLNNAGYSRDKAK